MDPKVPRRAPVQLELHGLTWRPRMPRRAGGTRQCGVERYSTPHCCVPPRCGAALTCAFGAFQAASALLWGSRAAAGSWALRLCGRWRRSRHACSASARAARWYATGRDRPVVPPPSYLRPHPHPSSLSVLCSRAPPRQPAHRQTDCVSVCRRVCLSVSSRENSGSGAARHHSLLY